MFEVSVISAFIGGLLTFLAPCTLPLIPAFLAFVSGRVDGSDVAKPRRNRMLLSALAFVSGFTIVFMFFGLASGTLGEFLITYKKQISQVGGVLIVLLGLGMLRVIPLPSLRALVRMQPPAWVERGTLSGGFALGLLFGFGWSPCLGPVLGTILILAGSTGSSVYGAGLLFVYAMGLAVPFLLFTYLYGSAILRIDVLARHLPLVARVGGVLVVIIGVLMIIGQFGAVSSLGFDLYRIPALGKLMDLM